jgi:hypothetical protein
VTQERTPRPYYNFVGGLDTEANELDFPENHSFDEENFELMPGGYRRRRYGLGFEPEYAELEIDESLPDDMGSDLAFVEFSWRGVGGSATRNWIVQQVGSLIYFFDDVRTNPSASLVAGPLDVSGLARPGINTDLVKSNPLTFASGRGRLLVAGREVEPFTVEYIGDTVDNPEEDVVRLRQTNVRERDFEEIEDGIPLSFPPFDLTDAHKYNLLNRGWRTTLIDQFKTDKSIYPAKNMLLSQAFQRSSATAGVNADDGVKEFSSDKLLAELFQDVSAPKGFFIVDPFDTTDVTTTFVADGLEVVSWTSADFTIPVQTVTLTLADDHGLDTSDIVIWRGARVVIRRTSVSFGAKPEIVDVAGEFTITSKTSDTITFVIDFSSFMSNPARFSRVDQAATLSQPNGTVTEADGSFPANISRPFGVSTDNRFSATTFYAGRAWYAGCDSERNASRIYFSQIIETPEQFGKCYQAADPTDININDLLPSDGGVIVVPELGPVTAMRPFSNSLLVLTQTGVWEVSGGRPGEPFTATSYNFRKLSDAKVYAPHGTSEADGALFYAAADGLHMVRLDPRAGILVDENISEEKVQTLWANIPFSNWDKIKSVYDPVYRRVWFLYSNERFMGWRYDRALILDARLGAYFKYTFHSDPDLYVAGAYVPRQFCCTGESAMKFATALGVGAASASSSVYAEFSYSEQLFPAVYRLSGGILPLENPRFLTDLSNWTATVLSGTGTVVQSEGTARFSVPSSGILSLRSDTVPVIPGRSISARVLYKSHTVDVSKAGFTPISLIFRDGADNVVSSVIPDAAPVAPIFVEYKLLPVTVPAGAVTVEVVALLSATEESTMELTNYELLDLGADVFREVDENSFKDWGNTVPAFLVTGAEILGEAARKKQAPIIHTFMRQTETGYEDTEVGGDLVPKNESGCFMTARWEWADDPIAGRWSVPKQIYKLNRTIAPEEDNGTYPYRTGHPVRVTRERISGMGRALSLKFESDGDKPCVLLGWSAEYSVNNLA